MTNKTIAKILRQKMNAFINSIEDDNLKHLVRRDAIITGGCIPSLLSHTKPNDYDVYFKTAETAEAVAKYYANKYEKLYAEIVNKKFVPHVTVINGLEFRKDWIKRHCKNQPEGAIETAAMSSDVELLAFVRNASGNNFIELPLLVRNTQPNRIRIMFNQFSIDDIGKAVERYEDTVDYVYDHRKIFPEENLEEEMNFNKSFNDLESGENIFYDTGDMLDKFDGTTVMDVMQYFKKMAKDKDFRYSPVFFSPHAITLSDDIQIIVRFTGEAEEIHKNFDFVHCTCYYDVSKEKLVLPANAISSLMHKELKFIGTLYPVSSLFRIRKFLKRGFTIPASEIFKICLLVSKLDLGDVCTLQDQLVGVDISYFSDLVYKVNQSNRAGNDVSMDNDRIVKLLDKIFG